MSVDSSDSRYRYVQVGEFNPNSADGWTAFGDAVQCTYNPNPPTPPTPCQGATK